MSQTKTEQQTTVFGCIKQTEEKTNDCLEDNRWDSFQDIKLLMKLKGALSVFVNICLIDNNNFHQLFTTNRWRTSVVHPGFPSNESRSLPSSHNTSSVEEATFRSFLKPDATVLPVCPLYDGCSCTHNSLTAANRQLYNHNEDRFTCLSPQTLEMKDFL